MFMIICGVARNDMVRDFILEIEGCPNYGVKAVDFRKKHGLPLAPHNHITLPGRMYENEAVAREFPLDNNADVNLEYIKQYESEVVNLKVESKLVRGLNADRRLIASPEVIKAYLDVGEFAAAGLIKDIIGYSARSKLRAEAQVYRLCQEELEQRAAKVKAVEDAKALLRDELVAKDNIITEMSQELEAAKITIENKNKEVNKWKKLYNELAKMT